MNLGISTSCFYPMQTEEAFEILCKANIPFCEIFFNADCELNDSFTKSLKNMADSYGVQIPAIHPFTAMLETVFFFSGYNRRTQEGFDQYKRYFHAMNVLGAKYLVFHGDGKGNLFSHHDGLEHLARLCEIAKEYGVTIAHENVSRCKGGNPEYLFEAARQIPDLRFVLDIKQTVRAGEDPYTFIDGLGSKIVHYHLSDHTPTHDCLAPGKGSFDFDKLFTRLGEMNYSGAMMVELYRHNFCELSELFEGYNYLVKKLRSGSFL